jgi:alkylhydroperoxidase domain protein
MSDTIIETPIENRPTAFTQDKIGWTAWLQPLAETELTERQYEALVDKARAKSPYFTLLVRDPDILEARTKTDNDIFYNTKDGLPRAERELAATAASRLNGCIFCASVHSRFASHYSKRDANVQKLLDDGVTVDLGPRWNAVVAASVALSTTPPSFGPQHVTQLREAGLTDEEISDAIHGAAFFNWANRLMLSIGEPTPAA